MMDFKSKVQGYLKDAGLSQKKLAEFLNYEDSYLSHKLSDKGRNRLNRPEIKKIIEYLTQESAITRQSEARDLLDSANCPHFSYKDWETTPLKELEKDWQPPKTLPSREHSGDKIATPSTSRSNQVFILYRHDIETDTRLALELANALSRQHQTHVESDTKENFNNPLRVVTAINEAEFLLLILSEQAARSELLIAEVEKAYHQASSQDGMPVILPVRVNYRKTLEYPLNLYIRDVNFTTWESPTDTPHLIVEVNKALEEGAFERNQLDVLIQVENWDPLLIEPTTVAQPDILALPEGTMDPQSVLYIERSSDKIAQKAIMTQGETIVIKGPRQMGKSSLLLRTIKTAEKAGKRIVYLDFQDFDTVVFFSATTFYQQFCSFVSEELGLEDQVEAFWKMPGGDIRCSTRYFQNYLLPRLEGASLVLAMDEVENIFESPFRSDFFGMLRSWHGLRYVNSIWQQLNMILVTSTEPYQFVLDLIRSPFNVGAVIPLEDFNREQVDEINHRYAYILGAPEVQRLMELLNGHPYLTRKAFYMLASGQLNSEKLFATATSNEGPFGEHLRYHFSRIKDKPELEQRLREVLTEHSCPEDHLFWRLRGAGLIRREEGKVLPRCQLYDAYFGSYL